MTFFYKKKQLKEFKKIMIFCGYLHISRTQNPKNMKPKYPDPFKWKKPGV